MENITKNIIGTVVRALLAFLSAYLLTTGLFTESEVANLIIGLTPIVIALIWGIIDKFIWKRTVNTALTLPANSSAETLQDVLKHAK